MIQNRSGSANQSSGRINHEGNTLQPFLIAENEECPRSSQAVLESDGKRRWFLSVLALVVASLLVGVGIGVGIHVSYQQNLVASSALSSSAEWATAAAVELVHQDETAILAESQHLVQKVAVELCSNFKAPGGGQDTCSKAKDQTTKNRCARIKNLCRRPLSPKIAEALLDQFGMLMATEEDKDAEAICAGWNSTVAAVEIDPTDRRNFRQSNIDHGLECLCQKPRPAGCFLKMFLMMSDMEDLLAEGFTSEEAVVELQHVTNKIQFALQADDDKDEPVPQPEKPKSTCKSGVYYDRSKQIYRVCFDFPPFMDCRAELGIDHLSANKCVSSTCLTPPDGDTGFQLGGIIKACAETEPGKGDHSISFGLNMCFSFLKDFVAEVKQKLGVVVGTWIRMKFGISDFGCLTMATVKYNFGSERISLDLSRVTDFHLTMFAVNMKIEMLPKPKKQEELEGLDATAWEKQGQYCIDSQKYVRPYLAVLYGIQFRAARNAILNKKSTALFALSGRGKEAVPCE